MREERKVQLPSGDNVPVVERKKPLADRTWFRIVFGIGLPLILLGGAAFLYKHHSPFPCVFHLLTGLYCPGCGAGRAAYALLHLDILSALSYNFLFVLLLPFIAYYILKMYIRVVIGKDILPFFTVSVKQFLIVLYLILLFWVLRNIPVVPFNYLAPGALLV